MHLLAGKKDANYLTVYNMKIFVLTLLKQKIYTIFLVIPFNVKQS